MPQSIRRLSERVSDRRTLELGLQPSIGDSLTYTEFVQYDQDDNLISLAYQVYLDMVNGHAADKIECTPGLPTVPGVSPGIDD